MGKGRITIRPTPMLRKQVGQMMKLLGSWNTSEMKYKKAKPMQPTQSVATEGIPQFLAKTDGIHQRQITRRQIVMNRHFTEIISDVLSNNLKDVLAQLGVTITSIETKAWNKGVSIFYSTDKPFNQISHKELNLLTGKLRYAVNERQLIGKTPLITFVYDENAELHKHLESVLSLTRKGESDETCDIVLTTTNELHVSSREFVETEPGITPRHFSSPPDMSNIMLGLNYPSLYNQVVSKLERGRGQSERMIPAASIASPPIPFIRDLNEDVEEEDPSLRLLKMQRFLVKQRKKNEYHAKLRRKEELFARDRVKWDLPDTEVDEVEDRDLEANLD